MSESNKKKCFVIMPFSKTSRFPEIFWSQHYKYLKELIEKTDKFEVFRSEPLRGSIPQSIIINLSNVDVVIADLTDYNPNVFWELGVRHSFKNCTITIAEEKTKIPFNISSNGVLYYHSDYSLNKDFDKKFHDALNDCYDHPELIDSPVLNALGGRGTLYKIIENEENFRKVQSLISDMTLNIRLFDIYKKSADDIKNNKSVSIPTGQFSISSLENLNINRFLDQKESFYGTNRTILINLKHLNTCASRAFFNSKQLKYFGALMSDNNFIDLPNKFALFFKQLLTIRHTLIDYN